MTLFSRLFNRARTHDDACSCEDRDMCDWTERRSEERQKSDAEKHHIRQRIDEATQRLQLLELQADVESRRQR